MHLALFAVGKSEFGNHLLVSTAAFIAFAQGRVLSQLRNYEGPISPGRWQL